MVPRTRVDVRDSGGGCSTLFFLRMGIQRHNVGPSDILDNRACPDRGHIAASREPRVPGRGRPDHMIGTYISPSFYQISNPVSAFVSVLYPAALLPVYVFGPSLPPLPSHPPMPQSTKTVVVLGASYAGKSKTSHVPYLPDSRSLSPHAGHRAVHQLVEKLPEDWRVVVVERNTYVLLSHLLLAAN